MIIIEKFVSEFNFNKDEYWKIKNFFEVYSTDISFREIIKNNRITELAANNKFNIRDYKDIENLSSKNHKLLRQQCKY